MRQFRDDIVGLIVGLFILVVLSRIVINYVIPLFTHITK